MKRYLQTEIQLRAVQDISKQEKNFPVIELVTNLCIGLSFMKEKDKRGLEVQWLRSFLKMGKKGNTSVYMHSLLTLNCIVNVWSICIFENALCNNYHKKVFQDQYSWDFESCGYSCFGLGFFSQFEYWLNFFSSDSILEHISR